MDQNKTKVTHHVTAAAKTYLKERGFKPVEPEVYVADSWIADLAGLCSPTRTEAQALKLLPRKPKYSSYPGLTGYSNDPKPLEAWEELYRTIPPIMTALVEVKTSRADFRGDRKWLEPSPVDLRYLAIPPGMLKPSEYPAGWGVLEATERQVRRVAQVPTLTPITPEKRFSVLFQVTMRMYNRVTYAHQKTAQQGYRSNENEYHNRVRVSKVVRMVLSLTRCEHESVEATMSYYGITVRDLSEEDRNRMDALWGCHKTPAV